MLMQHVNDFFHDFSCSFMLAGRVNIYFVHIQRDFLILDA